MAPRARAKAKPMFPYDSYSIHNGNHTQSVLKKKRYTQRCMKLLVSRFEDPESHSGAKVMKPDLISYFCRYHLPNAILTTIQLPSRQDARPEP